MNEKTKEVLPSSEAPKHDSDNFEDMMKELASEVPQLSQDEIGKLQELIQEIEYVGIDDIHQSPNKARKIRGAVPKVAESIKELGFRSPIYVDGDGEIIAGHTRHAAAKLLGLTRVPIVRVTDLTQAKVRLLRLADNRVAEFSAWNFDELNKEIGELKLELPELDFGSLGFIDKAELEWDDVDDLDDDNYDEPKENNLCCPKCGYTGGASFFKKVEAKVMKKVEEGISEDSNENVAIVNPEEGE